MQLVRGKNMILGKNAIITGARGGIGRSTVEIFARNGANIWACVRTKDEKFELEMKKLEEKYDIRIWVIYFDLFDEKQIKNAVGQIQKQHLSVDILVNIAGMVEDSTSFVMSSIDKMKKVFDTNFWGTTLLTQYVVRLMMRNKSGSIINVSSIAGIDGAPAQYEYATSKAAVNGAVRHLARELAAYNIRVNAVAPGIVETKMGNKIEEGLKKEILEKVIMHRMGTTTEIANVIAFLASDLSSYMTGQIIRVDGGM